MTAIAQQYIQRSGELLINLRNVEESLRKLQQQQQKPQQNEPSISDEDKIRLQFRLDIEEFISLLIIGDNHEEASELNVAVEQLRLLYREHSPIWPLTNHSS
jgi:hypothetical protein